MNDLKVHSGGYQDPRIGDTEVDGGEEVRGKEKDTQFRSTDQEFVDGPKTKTTTDTKIFRPVLDAPLKYDTESLSLMLMTLRKNVGDTQQKLSKEDIENAMANKEAANTQKLAKLKEFVDKLEEARKAGLAKKIFGWIGSVVGTVVSFIAAVGLTIGTIAAAVTGVGAGAAIGLGLGAAAAWAAFVGSAASLGSMIADAIINAIPDMNADVKKNLQLANMITSMAISIVAATISLILGIAGSIVTFGATGITAAVQMINCVTNIITGIGQIVAGTAQVGAGASGIAEAVLTKDAVDAKADSMEFSKVMKKLQAMMEDEMDRLKELLEQLDESMSNVMQIFSSGSETKGQIIKQMI